MQVRRVEYSRQFKVMVALIMSLVLRLKYSFKSKRRST